MKYSKILHVEHEEPMNEHGEGAYTVFNLIQPLGLDFNLQPKVHIQKLAVLWNKQTDTRLIAMIEKGLIQGALSPIKLLYVADGSLNIIYNVLLDIGAQSRFETLWIAIAREAWGEKWTANFIPCSQAYATCEGDNALRTYADVILCSHGLGLWEFTGDRLHHHNRWQPGIL